MPLPVAYNLTLSAPFSFPELLTEDREADVTVSVGAVLNPPPLSAGSRQSLRVIEGEACFVVQQVGAFLIRHGKEIIVEPTTDADEEEIRLFLLGPALAFVLHQRGSLVLHASAVALAGKAVAFLGNSGWGKSTLAAALHGRGFTVVADDAVALQAEVASPGGTPHVIPGFPQVKLWPEAAVALGYDLEGLPRLHSRIAKRAVETRRGFDRAPMPLSAIYILAESQTTAIDPLPAKDAWLELVRHSYCMPFLPAADAPEHFLQCARVARLTPLRRLRVRRAWTALPDLERLIRQALREET